MGKPLGNKVTSAAEAVRRFVSDGAVVGMGGQSIGRCAMALSHEVIRQGRTGLSLVGCNLSLSMDMMVGAGLVRRTECGTGNLERFGTAFRWRRAIEEGRIEVEDFSHLAIASRFLAGSLGLPFMPSKSLLGSDVLNRRRAGSDTVEVVSNPWDPEEPVVLLRACTPDVSIVHVQRADEMGNLIVDGFTTHEVEMIKASKAVIASCEELVSSDEVRRSPELTTVPYLYVDAVVEQPWGGYPTSVYRYYEHDGDHLRAYQARARSGGEPYREYLRENVYDCADFQEFLARALPQAKREELAASMRRVL